MENATYKEEGLDENAGLDENERNQLLSELGSTLETKKRRAIQHKTQIEYRMLLDEAQYWGLSEGRTTKVDRGAGEGPLSRRSGSPTDNKTRSKTRIAAARIGDMLFPTNQPNWAMRPTPYPQVSDEAIEEEYARKQTGQLPVAEGQPPPPQTPYDPEELANKAAWRACRKMTRRIGDALSKSMYPKIGRAVIMDACKLGTGIIKGPYNRGVIQRRYTPSSVEGERVDVLQTDMVPTPSVARVSPWNFFPLPARCIEECEVAFEMHLPTKTALRQMVMSHGFDPERTERLISTSPHRGEVDEILSQRAAITGDNSMDYSDNWAVWEYHGPIDKEDLSAWTGIEMDSDLDSLYGEVWFANGEILRMNLSMLEADSSLPYHVFCYEEDETSIFGFGIPFVMRDDQYVIDMMWDAMTYNAAVSSGPQIAITKGVMTPADNSYVIRGPKLWYNNDEEVSLKDAIEVMVIPSTIQTNMPLYEQAKANADENTNLPLMLGDAMAQATSIPTSGLSMLINQQNIVQRQSAHSWDDNITGRLLPRFYDWYMQHDPDPSIKGDYDVEVRGASYLLIKDTQAQHAQLLIQMAAQDPSLAGMMNMSELYRTYLGFMDIPVDLLMKTDDEIQQDQANQQPDPLQELELAEAQAKVDKLGLEAQKLQGEIQAGAGQEGMVTEQDMLQAELEMAKLQDAGLAREIQMEIEQIRRDTHMMRAAADEGIAYEKIQADLEKFHRKQGEDSALKQRKQESEDYFKAASLRMDEYRDRMKQQNLARGFDTFG